MKNLTKMYVLKEPKHITESIIYLDDNYFSEKTSLSQEFSDYLDIISKYSDIIFIFPKNLCSKVIPNKFSSLYNAMAYAVTNDSEVKSMKYIIDYSINIFNEKHIGYWFIGSLDYMINNFSKDRLESDLMRFLSAHIGKSVFESRRLNSEELSNIYTNTGINYSFIQKICGKPELDSMNGMFCTHSTNDGLLYLNIPLSKVFVNDTNSTYINTFDNYSFESFISSLVEHLDNKNEYFINHSIVDILKIPEDNE